MVQLDIKLIVTIICKIEKEGKNETLRVNQR